MLTKTQIYAIVILCVSLNLLGCGSSAPPHLKPVSGNTIASLAKKGFTTKDPIFIRIFKQESELELWKQKKDGIYYHFKTYPICKWSGKLGPKLRHGDKQAPEGFYRVSNSQMNPSSKYYLSFNLGFPNSYDRAHGRTGRHLMVHGNCESRGCYAMTDALIEEIYLLARDSFIGGQKTFEVHAFPFRMTKKNMAKYKKHKWIRFWKTIKEGHDFFENSRRLPKIDVCNKNYLINAAFTNQNARVFANRPCPRYKKQIPALYLGKTELQPTQTQWQRFILSSSKLLSF